MKKIWLLLALLLPLGACELEEWQTVTPVEEIPVEFVPLFQNSNRSKLKLRLHIVKKADRDWDAAQEESVEPEFDKLRVITLYRKNCPDCEDQAPYLIRLAEDFRGAPIEFSVIITDLHSDDSREELEQFRKLDWVQQLDSHIRMYIGPYVKCPYDETQQENFCQKAFESWWILETPFSFLIVKEKDDTDRFLPNLNSYYRKWPHANASDSDKEKSYEILHQMVEDFLNQYGYLYS
jgi:thiol-disulfide isomerase/thioredoxin